MNEIIANIDQYANIGLTYLQNTTILIVTIAVGMIIGLFGLKLKRVFSAFMGILIGAIIGGIIAESTGVQPMIALGIIAGSALLLAILFGIVCRIGIFFYMLFMVAGLFFVVTQNQSLIFIGIAFGLGLVAAIITMIWFDPFIIIFTSIDGGLVAGQAIVSLAGLDQMLVACIAIPVALSALFMLIQFLMRSKQVGKDQTEKAKTHKAKTSRENEVEEARRILDLDDIDDLDDDYEDDEDYYNDDSESDDEEDYSEDRYDGEYDDYDEENCEDESLEEDDDFTFV